MAILGRRRQSHPRVHRHRAGRGGETARGERDGDGAATRCSAEKRRRKRSSPKAVRRRKKAAATKADAAGATRTSSPTSSTATIASSGICAPPRPSASRALIMWSGGTLGPRVLPGTYQAKLTVGDQPPVTTSFEIRQDPRSTSTAADLKAQFDFVTSVHDKLSEVNEQSRAFAKCANSSRT